MEKAKTNSLRKLYYWCLSECEKPYSFWFITLFAFLESIIIPVPTDPLLLAKATAEPKKALSLSFWVSVFSITGGIAGYFLGAVFWDVLSPIIYKYIFSEQVFMMVRARFEQSVFLFVVIGGFTPLPFKAFALTAGAMNLSFAPFVLGCIVGRGLRFFTLGTLIYFFGPQIRNFIDRYLERLFLLCGIVAGLFLIFKYFNG